MPQSQLKFRLSDMAFVKPLLAFVVNSLGPGRLRLSVVKFVRRLD